MLLPTISFDVCGRASVIQREDDVDSAGGGLLHPGLAAHHEDYFADPPIRPPSSCGFPCLRTFRDRQTEIVPVAPFPSLAGIRRHCDPPGGNSASEQSAASGSRFEIPGSIESRAGTRLQTGPEHTFLDSSGNLSANWQGLVDHECGKLENLNVRGKRQPVGDRKFGDTVDHSPGQERHLT